MSKVRKEKKISQDALAKKIGQHGALIGRYERNELKPSIEIGARIAEDPGSITGLSCEKYGPVTG